MSLDSSSAMTTPDDLAGNAADAAAPQSEKSSQSLRERWVEIVSVALLAIASLTAAWCGYQATLWGGEQSAHYSQAGANRVESARANGLAVQLTQIDVEILLQWINASQSGDQDLADFYESRFTDVLQPAFDAWIATDPFNNPDAPNSPFAMPEYVQPATIQSRELEQEAQRLFDQGQEDNKIGDDFVLATVFLATALFFLAVSTSLDWFWAKVGLIGVAGLMVVTAVGFAATLPMAG